MELRYLRDTNKYTNAHIMRDLEGKRKRRSQDKYIKQNSPKLPKGDAKC